MSYIMYYKMGPKASERRAETPGRQSLVETLEARQSLIDADADDEGGTKLRLGRKTLRHN